MKSFDEWFEEKYTEELYSDDELTILYEASFIAWQSAQEVQRDSDMVICNLIEDSYLAASGKQAAKKCSELIRNNKSV